MGFDGKSQEISIFFCFVLVELVIIFQFETTKMVDKASARSIN